MIDRVFKYLRLEQKISEPRTDYGLLLEKTIGQFNQLFSCSSGTTASVFPKLAKTFKTVSN